MIKNYATSLNKILLVLFFIAFKFNSAKAQVVNTNTEDIILQIEHFNFEKQLNSFTEQLYNFKGTHLVAYCKNLEVLMLRVNRDIQADDTKMFEVLKKAGYVFVIKENASVEKVQAACTDKKENPNYHQE